MSKEILIVGAGDHGRVVAETAKACGYEKIDFIDDNDPTALGKTEDLERLKREYSDGFVAIGNPQIREKMQQKLLEYGYEIPVLVHPSAYVSPSAGIGIGTVVEPMAVINTNATIEDGCIISIGSRIDHEAHIGKFSHVNTGAIVMAYGMVPEYTKVDAGQVVKDSRSI